MPPKPIRNSVEALTHSVLWRTTAAIGLLWCAAIPSGAMAQGVPLDARVIWVQGDRVYLASRDSVSLTVGTTLHFAERGKTVASGSVVGIQDATLIVARVSVGSIKNGKRLDRIRVTSEPASPQSFSVLRVGYPSSARIQPFFECRRMVLDPHGYRADTLGTRAFRLVRDSTRAAGRTGPDTLLVRLFDDAADEEIALERSELDVAVFWPGEASAHIREVMRWAGEPKPVRNWGVIGARTKGSITAGFAFGHYSAREMDTLHRLNTEMFRDDLTMVSHEAPDSLFCPPLSFEVDSVPGRQAIERVLSRVPKSGGQRVLLTYLDRALPEREKETDPARWLYFITCPAISRPELRPYLAAIDLSAIVNLFDCVTPQRKP